MFSKIEKFGTFANIKVYQNEKYKTKKNNQKIL